MAIKLRHTSRYKEIVVALVRHGFGYMVEEMGLFHVLSLPRKWLHRGAEKTPHTFAERIRLVIEELGPTFIKLGQLSATRQDLLAPELVKELQKLQDQVPAFSMEEVKAILEEELHTPMNEIFSEFRETPLAAASIGQVHYARLHSGERVAVKVQRPHVDKIIELDLDILHDLAALAERRIGWFERYRVRTIIEELSRSMREELNYTREGKNTDRIAAQFLQHPGVRIPKIYWPYTTSKVLTMEYLDGLMLNQADELIERGHNLKVTAERLVNAMFHQVLIEGFFHADPHPGNVMVLTDGKIAFVDFGLVGRLDETMKFHLGSLIIGLMRKDSDAIIHAISQLGLLTDDVDMASLRQDLDEMREHYYDIPLSQVSLGEAMNEMFAVANRHRVLIPTDLTLLGKAMITVEGVAVRLYPELSLVDLAEPYGRRLFKERYHPDKVRQRWWRQATEFVETLAGFPRQAAQLTKLLRTGKLKVEIGLPEIDLLLRKLDQISNRISVSIVLLSFSIIMVGLIIASSVGNVPALILHFPVIEVGSTVAGLMFLWLLYSIFKSGRF
ncbi:AarF/ABC1/UbiB kinase family protein [Paenibacillus aurantius]|uniref:AarF/ABC1/UbiB kinase family protein n=1 Tax=Paenibacillus aurantius TaxID=2918900 RepID=A0AA96LH39_9BACL|nr:AarF/ABC1/UbiB kinase family protein [Paenibacillus aurantius]WNQ11357.1 AarF/ABC1/UbiB kinase family protein [Paenibacillus aurantius]